MSSQDAYVTDEPEMEILRDEDGNPIGYMKNGVPYDLPTERDAIHRGQVDIEGLSETEVEDKYAPFALDPSLGGTFDALEGTTSPITSRPEYAVGRASRRLNLATEHIEDLATVTGGFANSFSAVYTDAVAGGFRIAGNNQAAEAISSSSQDAYMGGEQERQDMMTLYGAGGKAAIEGTLARREAASAILEEELGESLYGTGVQVSGALGSVSGLVAATTTATAIAGPWGGAVTSFGLLIPGSFERTYKSSERAAIDKFIRDNGKRPTVEQLSAIRDNAYIHASTYGTTIGVAEMLAERILTKPGAKLLRGSVGSTFGDVLATIGVKTAGEGFSGATTQFIENFMVKNHIDETQELTEGLYKSMLLEMVGTGPVAIATTATGNTLGREILAEDIAAFFKGEAPHMEGAVKKIVKEMDSVNKAVYEYHRQRAERGDAESARVVKAVDEETAKRISGGDSALFAVSVGPGNEGGTKLSRGLVEDATAPERKKLAKDIRDNVVIVDTELDLQGLVSDGDYEAVLDQRRRGGKVEGFISTVEEDGKLVRKTVLIANNLKTTERAVEVLRHEAVGHQIADLVLEAGGLSEVYFWEVADRWGDSALGAQIHARYASKWEQQFKGLPLAEAQRRAKVELGQELVANMAEKGRPAQPRLWDSVVGFVRRQKPEVSEIAPEGPEGDARLVKALGLFSRISKSNHTISDLKKGKDSFETGRAAGEDKDAKYALDPDALVEKGLTVGEHLADNHRKTTERLDQARKEMLDLAEKHGIYLLDMQTPIADLSPKLLKVAQQLYIRVRDGEEISDVESSQFKRRPKALLKEFQDARAKVYDWASNERQAREMAEEVTNPEMLRQDYIKEVIAEDKFRELPVPADTLGLMEAGATVGEVLDSLEENAASSSGRLLAKTINGIITQPEDRAVPIGLSPEPNAYDPSFAGAYFRDLIGVSTPDLSHITLYQPGGDETRARTMQTLLHEIVHAASAKSLDQWLLPHLNRVGNMPSMQLEGDTWRNVSPEAHANRVQKSLDEALENAPPEVRNFYEVFDEVRTILQGNTVLGDVFKLTGIPKESLHGGLYSMSDPAGNEFITAVFTDTQFMELLRRLPTTTPAGALTSIANKIMEAIVWMLGGRQASLQDNDYNYLAKAIKAGAELMALPRPTQEQLVEAGAIDPSRQGIWLDHHAAGLLPHGTSRQAFIKMYEKGQFVDSAGVKNVFKKRGALFSIATTEMADGSTIAVDHNHDQWVIKPIPEHFKQEGFIYENIDLSPVQKKMLPDGGQRIAKSMDEAVSMIERLSIQSPKFSLPLALTEAELENLVNAIKDPKLAEGFTMDLRTVFAEGGFAVAPRKETEFVVAQTAFDVETMRTYLTQFATDFEREGAHLGGWLNTDSNEFMLDVVFPLPSYEDAVRVSIWGDQDAIFNLSTFDEIRTKYKNGNAKVPKGFKENRATIQARKPVDSIANAKAAEASYRKSGGVRGKGVSPVGGFLHAQAKYSLAQESHGLGFLKGTEVVRDLPSRPTIIQIANYFQKQFGKPIDFTKPKEGDNARIEEALYKEVLFGMTLQPNAAGWYDENLGAAMSILKLMDPDISELENDFLFKAVLAITSDGNRVQGQFDQTWETYQNWKTTGQLTADATSGTRIPTIHANIAKLNRVIAALGTTKAAHWLTRKGTVKEIRAAAVKDLGFSQKEAKDLISSELIDEVVPYASLFGPKIGSFFNNLYGDYSTVTMDRWFMRTLGRNTGTQVAPPTPAKWRESKTRLREAVAALSKEEARYLRISSTQAKGNKALELAKRLHGYFTLEANRKAVEMSGMGEGWVKDASSLRMDEVRLAANHLHGLSSPLVEAPRSGSHRRWIRQRIAGVQAKLIANGTQLENAELQAVLWYVEKELYNALGYNTRTGIDPTTGEVVEDTPDYASAAEQLHQRIKGGPSGVAGTGGAIGKATPGAAKFSLGYPDPKGPRPTPRSPDSRFIMSTGEWTEILPTIKITNMMGEDFNVQFTSFPHPNQAYAPGKWIYSVQSTEYNMSQARNKDFDTYEQWYKAWLRYAKNPKHTTIPFTPEQGRGELKFSIAPSKRRLDDDVPLRHQWLPVAQPGSTRDVGEYQRQVLREQEERGELIKGLEAEGHLPDDILAKKFPPALFSLEDGPELGTSKLILRVKADSDLPERVRERLTEAYVVQGHQEVLDRAVAYLDQFENYEEAMGVVNTDDFFMGRVAPELDSTDRAMIAMRVLKAIGMWSQHIREVDGTPDKADQLDDMSIDLTYKLADHGRLAGRTISVLQEWGQLNPYAIQSLVKRRLIPATEHKLKKKGGKGVADAIHPILAAVKAAGLGTLDTEAFKKHLEKLYHDGDLTLWGRYRKSAADRISTSIRKWLGEPGPSAKKTSLAKFTDELVKEMKARMELDGKKAPNQITDWFPILKDALENGEKYHDVWTTVGETLKNRLTPEEFGQVEEELGDMLTDPSGKILESTVEQQIKELNIKISELVQEHYSKRDATSFGLVKLIMKRLDLEPWMANRISTLVTSTINRKMKEETKKQLDSLVTKFNKPKQTRVIKSMADRIIPLVNMGAMDKADTYEAVAKIMGVKGVYDKQFANKIKKISDRIQKAPEGFQKNNEVLNLMNAISNQAGDGIVRMALNFRIANLLSAPATHTINITSNAMLATLMLSTQFMRARGNPNVIIPMFSAMAKGLMKGTREARSIATTGRGRAGFELSKFMPDPYLERKRFKGGKLNPANWWKGIMRAMAMMDVLFRFTNIEGKAAFLAGMEAKEKGYKGKAKRDYIKEALGYTEEFEKAAVSQAESELSLGYLKNKVDVKRRVDELMESNRSEDITELSNAYGYLSTFQNRPEGIVGIAANAMGQLAHPGRKPGEVVSLSRGMTAFAAQWFVPFIRVVANVLNMTLDFTPGIGYARAKLHKTGVYHQVHLTARDKTDDEIQDMYARNLLGQAFTLVGASLFFGEEEEEDPKWDITGAGPKGWQQLKTWKEDGNAPYQIIVDGKKYGYKEWPIAGLLSFLGGMKDAQRFDGDKFNAPDMWKRGAMNLMRLTYDQNFAKGVRDFFNFFSGEEQHAGAAVQNLKSGAKSFVVPNLVNHIDRVFDTTKYTENDVDQWLVLMTPFARTTGHPTLDVWGQPAHYTEDEGFPALFDRVISNYNPDPLLTKLINHKIIPVKPNKNTAIRVDDDALSPTERAQDLYVYQWYRGRYLRQFLTADKEFDRVEAGSGKPSQGYDTPTAQTVYASYLNAANRRARGAVMGMTRKQVLETMAKIKKAAKPK